MVTAPLRRGTEFGLCSWTITWHGPASAGPLLLVVYHRPMRCAVWAAPEQLQLLQRAFDTDALTCAVLGCDDPAARDSMAAALQAEPVDDVRQLLLSPSIDAAWLAAPGVLDADIDAMAGDLPVPVATSAPFVEGFQPDLYGKDNVHFIPLLRGGPTWLAASGCIELLGDVHCIQVSATAGDHQTSLRALLLDAADLVVHVAGMPEEVFAAQSGGPMTPDPTGGIAGHLTSTMRFANGCTASITVSDGGGSWVRRATVLGTGGRVMVTDEGVSWTDPDGEAQEAPPTESHATAGALSQWHLCRLGDDKPDPQPSPDVALLCETLRLSCVTGQVEQVDHVARMFT